MKIYTKTGDSGTTSLIYGKKVSKADLKIDAYGTVDELNAYIGLLKDQTINEKRAEFLFEIQRSLFTIGSNLASEKLDHNLPKIHENDVKVIENEIDVMNEELDILKNFILPGGHNSVSICHIARTVCRRAERTVVRLQEFEPVDLTILKYLNRLSDYLFVLSRKMLKELDLPEVIWKA